MTGSDLNVKMCVLESLPRCELKLKLQKDTGQTLYHTGKMQGKLTSKMENVGNFILRRVGTLFLFLSVYFNRNKQQEKL